MDTIVGRGGNQFTNLVDAGVAPVHCIISQQGRCYKIQPLNVAPTYIDGRRLYELGDTFSGDAQISVGNHTSTVEELFKRVDFSGIIDWGYMAERIPDALSALIFNEVTLGEYIEDETEAYFLSANVDACQAYYLIKDGKLRAAQELLYLAGDILYQAQDGSGRLKTAYASLLILLSWLYANANREEYSKEALKGAKYLISIGAKCTSKVMSLFNSLQ